MDSNFEENVDPSLNVVQRIIINNFEINSKNNFLSSSSKESEKIEKDQNDITLMADMDNYRGDEEKNLSKDSSDFTKMLEEDTYDDIIKEKKYYIFCKTCNNLLALEGITYSKLK
jgi:hypothetical protein